MNPSGKTSFVGGRLKTAINFVDRLGTKIGNVTLVRPAFHGAWFGKCAMCGKETVYTKEKIRRGSVRCCP